MCVYIYIYTDYTTPLKPKITAHESEEALKFARDCKDSMPKALTRSPCTVSLGFRVKGLGVRGSEFRVRGVGV